MPHPLRMIARRFSWENSLAQPNHEQHHPRSWAIEDGLAALDPAVENSQLYMYVGKKQSAPAPTRFDRNGLANGVLYVFALARSRPRPASSRSRAARSHGSGSRSPIAEYALDETLLEAAIEAVGAMYLRTASRTVPSTRRHHERLLLRHDRAALPTLTSSVDSIRSEMAGGQGREPGPSLQRRLAQPQVRSRPATASRSSAGSPSWRPKRARVPQRNSESTRARSSCCSVTSP